MRRGPTTPGPSVPSATAGAKESGEHRGTPHVPARCRPSFNRPRHNPDAGDHNADRQTTGSAELSHGMITSDGHDDDSRETEAEHGLGQHPSG